MSIKFSVVLGVISGYAHNNCAGFEDALRKSAATRWQEAAKSINEKCGVYVSASISPALVVFSQDWGCPEGGEVSILVQGSQNPHFCPSTAQYKDAVVEVVKRVQEALQQTTAMIEFHEVESIYLRREIL